MPPRKKPAPDGPGKAIPLGLTAVITRASHVLAVVGPGMAADSGIPDALTLRDQLSDEALTEEDMVQQKRHTLDAAHRLAVPHAGHWALASIVQPIGMRRLVVSLARDHLCQKVHELSAVQPVSRWGTFECGRCARGMAPHDRVCRACGERGEPVDARATALCPEWQQWNWDAIDGVTERDTHAVVLLVGVGRSKVSRMLAELLGGTAAKPSHVSVIEVDPRAPMPPPQWGDRWTVVRLHAVEALPALAERCFGAGGRKK